MALGGKALGNGWHDQAARFVGMHGTTRTKRAQSSFDDEAATSEADLAHELEVASARIAGLERRLGQETAATQTLREHVQLLAQQFDAAELRVAEMETELAAAQDRAARHDNESQSLQTSLDLAMAENARLSQRLELSDCALEDACTELARQQAACAKATGERSKLAGEVFAANGKRLNETTELKDQLETMSARALTAERLLTDARECLQARITENGVTERSLAEMTAARRDADNQIKQQQDLLCVKQCQLNELDQSRQELVAAMNALLKACQNRETALTQAEDKIEALTGRIAQLEAEAREANRQLAQTQAQLRAEQRRRPPARRVATDAADEKARINWAELASEFAKLVKLKGQVTEPRPASSPTALLASTITF